MLQKVDINCDMGEVCINTGKNIDDQIMPYISSCNIATGAHAGDLETMVKTMYLANMHQVAIGIHPSYVDREHFGRVTRNITHEAFAAQILRQFDVFAQISEKLNFKTHHCKPHGALYHDLSSNEAFADIFIGIIQKYDAEMCVYGMSGSRFSEKVLAAGLNFKHEAFADRQYATLTKLVARTQANALLTKEADIQNQIDHFIKGQVQTENAGLETIKVDTICIHSDTPDAPLLAQKIKNHLDQSKIEITYN